MEFKHIEYFIETCGYRSMSQAAEALFISQQALSRCIQNMESELGCKLFSRTVKGSTLTEEGQYFYNQLQPIVQRYRDTLNETISHLENRPQKLPFACAPLIFGILDTELLFSFEEANPGITLERLEMSDQEVDRYVAERPDHFGLLAIPEEQHGKRSEYIPIQTLPLRLYVHKNSPLAKLDQVEFSMLRNENFLAMEKRSHYHRILQENGRANGFTPKVTYESADISEVYKLVNRGKGIFLAIDSATVASRFPNIRVIPFREDTLTYCIAFVFQRYDSLPSAAMKFIRFVVAHAPEEDRQDRK